jgi:predicted DNA-binding transcriptional regulator YafY
MTTETTVQLYDALHKSIETNGALHVLYASGGDVVKERTIRPMGITIGRRGSDLVHAEDSLRGCVLTFRIDRFVAYEPVEAAA